MVERRIQRPVERTGAPARPPQPEYVFLISQIGDKGSPERKRADEVYEHIVCPVAEELGLEVKRSDLDPTPGQLTTQIVKGIINARAVVADLTGRNPNVFFELGVAQSFGRPLVLLVQDARSLPFDVKSERTIEVGDGPVLGVSEAKEAVKQLRASLDVVLAPGYEPTNLVTEVASARSLDALAPENPMASEVAALREMVEEIHGIVRRSSIGGPSRTFAKDFEALRRFVEGLVEQDRLYPSELVDAMTNATSDSFDSWARRMAARAAEIELLAQGVPRDEEPF